MKIKCVSNIDYEGSESVYLTVGKVYDSLIGRIGEFAIIDDHGDLITDLLDSPAHGKFEVVSE